MKRSEIREGDVLFACRNQDLRYGGRKAIVLDVEHGWYVSPHYRYYRAEAQLDEDGFERFPYTATKPSRDYPTVLCLVEFDLYSNGRKSGTDFRVEAVATRELRGDYAKIKGDLDTAKARRQAEEKRRQEKQAADLKIRRETQALMAEAGLTYRVSEYGFGTDVEIRLDNATAQLLAYLLTHGTVDTL